MVNEYAHYEKYLRELSQDNLESEYRRQRDRENRYAASQAAHDAAIFFGMMSYASSDAWKVNSCKKELEYRRDIKTLKELKASPQIIAAALVRSERVLTEHFVTRSPRPAADWEDELDEIISQGFEYLCRTLGVAEAEKLCKDKED